MSTTLIGIVRGSCSGKSSISKHLKSYISNEFGPTLLVSGDSLRNIFKFRNELKSYINPI